MNGYPFREAYKYVKRLTVQYLALPGNNMRPRPKLLLESWSGGSIVSPAFQKITHQAVRIAKSPRQEVVDITRLDSILVRPTDTMRKEDKRGPLLKQTLGALHHIQLAAFDIDLITETGGSGSMTSSFLRTSRLISLMVSSPL